MISKIFFNARCALKKELPLLTLKGFRQCLHFHNLLSISQKQFGLPRQSTHCRELRSKFLSFNPNCTGLFWEIKTLGRGGGASVAPPRISVTVLPIDLKICTCIDNHVTNKVARKKSGKMSQCVIIAQLIVQYAHFEQFSRKMYYLPNPKPKMT